ncbi:glycoside hydrolase family 3 protein [Actinomadura sp. LCR2-06]|uniref:Glycoside hydrolase family 3 protein n=2 Tax=Actinomadura violacea TaxID=2819934 RepID=A0ABS3S8V1_9ACTN|nr:glycoside hydrolase family 3 protein [Actinomadura violacea]
MGLPATGDVGPDHLLARAQREQAASSSAPLPPPELFRSEGLGVLTELGRLLDDPRGRQVIERHLPLLAHEGFRPKIAHFSLYKLAVTTPSISVELLHRIEAELAPAPCGADTERALRDRVRLLDLPSKVRLLTGADFWTLPGDPVVGLRPLVLSDGPAGVRGEARAGWEPSLNLPSGSALGATWDAGCARRYGDLLGEEARRKGVDVVLGPTINLHRSPYGGRHFEAMSEDPLLTAVLAASYVEALQAHGVAACPKHYVANDYEVDRHTASSEVDERTLHEVYLAPFERAVTEAGAWVVMSAYNAVNGTTMSEHPLLRDPLKSAWGFDGPVLSDWVAVKTTDESARSAQDLVMPSVLSPWGDALVGAVRAGRVPEAAVDEKVLRLLRLAARVGAVDGVEAAPRETVTRADAAAAAEAVTGLAVESMVLLHNDGVLPWAPAPRSIAVIGPSALAARTQGGGSAAVTPEHVVSPLDGLRSRFPDADIDFHIGTAAPNGVLPLVPDRMLDPVSGRPGMRATLTDAAGNTLFDEVGNRSEASWLGTLPDGATTLVLRTRYTPESSGRHLLGAACTGAVRVDLDGSTVIEEHRTTGDIARALSAPPVATVPVELTAGAPVDLTLTYDLTTALPMVCTVALGLAPLPGTEEEMITAAVAAAERSEAAVVVVGTGPRDESEGFDRTTLALPGRQDRLVDAVTRANPRTVVVVNAGGPVLMPWREQAGAVLLGWFGGQEMGTALARVLAGDAEPGGRLPTTWPDDEESVPVGPDRPVAGKVHYTEGLHVGHRAWLRSGAQPAYWFGHGLGYTKWNLSGLRAPERVAAGADVPLSLTVENSGERPGKQVVQVYLSRDESEIERPVRWLAGFAAVRLGPGERRTVHIDVPGRALAAWTGSGWWHEPGTFQVHVGTSIADAPLTARIDVTA